MSVPARGTTDPAGLDATEVEALTRRALRLSQFTVAYNVAEGVVAVAAGLLAGLVSLVGFGLDSGIESATAVLVALRLSARLRLGEADEAKERRTLRAVAVTFFALAGYVTVEGIRSLAAGDPPEHSTAGIVLLVLSVVIMPVLARASGAWRLPWAGTGSSWPTPPRPRSACCSASPPWSPLACTR